jgi:3alpha(or 20beta)-hydroxysteroid dehydrogenase
MAEPEFAGKVALVTGGARGVGAEIGRRLVSEGARVVLADILDDRGKATAEEIGDMARYRHLDVTQEDDWAEAIEDVARQEGHLEILVNNAAVLHLSIIDATSKETWDKVMAVNLLGVFLGTKAALPLMRKSEHSAIVNVGSIDSIEGVPSTVAYTTSKFALKGLTRVTALENGKYGVRANLIAAAAGGPEMRTELVGELREAPPKNLTANRRPIHRRGTPADVAAAVAYLASDDGSFISGIDLLLDGGGRAGWYKDNQGFTVGPL